ncbi:ABC transporter ATP-binding protein/permease [Weissella cibaria]|nr:ABC transporter ATP-binding protein [Weissella cibaria]MBZ5940954.1 ABC transporter ATP-binding protein/permease [Weissella cibaria]MYV35625.1 ATP-binding cassette domain-containing protein [Weissella cibaria]
MRSFQSGGRGRGGGMNQPVEKPVHFWQTIGRLFGYLGNYRAGVIVSLVITAISVVLSVRAPKVLGEATTVIFDDVTKSMRQHTALHIQMDKVVQILMLVSALYLIAALFSVIQQYIMTRVAQGTVYQLRKDFKEKMARLPVSYYDSHQNGDIMSRMVNDMDNIQGTLNQSLIQLVNSALTFVGVIYFMLTISWQLSLVAFLTVPLSLLIVRIIAPRSQRYFARQQAALGLLNDQVEETFAGHTVVKTFNQEQPMIMKFDAQNDDYYKAAWKAQFVSTVIFPSMRFVNNLDYLAMAVIGGIKVASGAVSLGDVQAMLQYTNQFSQPITQIANLTNTIQATVASAERIFQVLDEPEMTELTPVDPVTTDDIVTFEHVAFSYQPDQPLMTDYSMSVKPGQMIAIVGPTGAGKSTMINLLERFYDTTSGVIRLRGADTRGMTREDLRHHFAMVLQETWLFEGSIMDNLRYGRLEATDDDVIAAAKMAHADEFIRTLPEGYDTILNQDATNISQGQRQLLTIARAFIANPEILILDEATSSVDTRTERMIQDAMAKLLAGRTSFVVAHRLSTIRYADQILVMENGDIVERGRHDDLLAAGGEYAKCITRNSRKSVNS